MFSEEKRVMTEMGAAALDMMRLLDQEILSTFIPADKLIASQRFAKKDHNKEIPTR